MQTGGALFAAGDYGCLFKDSTPICSSTQEPINSEIGKVITASGSGQQEELKKTRILRSIPELQNYIIVPTKSCRAASSQPDPDWYKCALTGSDSPLLILGMKFGGETLKQTLNKTEWFCKHFISIMEHLLEGLVLLHKNNWLHTDIHDKNIMIDANGKPWYIDFGLAHNKKKPNKEELDKFTEFNPNLNFMPPEYHVYSMHANEIDTQAGLEQISKNPAYSRYNQILNKTEDIRDVLEKLSKNNKVMTDSVTFYNTYGDKLDIYSLGVCFFNAYLHCSAWPNQRSIPEFDTKRIKAILAKMLEYDPDQRYSALQMLEFVNPNNHFFRVLRPPPFSSNIFIRRGTQ
jgi:hypothetical protein